MTMAGREPDLLREFAPGPKLAIAAEGLFLANLMSAPGVGFMLLVLLWAVFRKRADALTRNHLEQTVVASLWGGAVLLGVSLAIFLLGGLENPWSWVVGVLYFLCFHAMLILGGMIGLNRAVLARPWRFPLIGPRIRN
jgi:hypothetical protein